MRPISELETVQEKIGELGNVVEHKAENEVFDREDFKGVAFIESEFKQCDFKKVEMQEAKFVNCVFSQCSFVECNQINAVVTGSKFDSCTWIDCAGAKMIRINAVYKDCVFEGFDDEAAQWSQVTFERATFGCGKLLRSSFMSCDFTESEFRDVSFETTAFMKAKTDQVRFHSTCSFDSVMLHEAVLDGHDWTGMSLLRTHFQECSLKSNIFNFSKMEATGFHDCDMEQSQFENLDSEYSRFFKVELKKSNFRRAKLMGSQFTESNIDFADLSEADLSKSMIMGCSAKKARFDQVNLTESTVENNDVRGSVLTYLKLKYTKIDRLIEDDDTDWTGTVKLLMRLNDDRENG